MSDPRTTLSPGDLVAWDEGIEGRGVAIMLVSDDGGELLFQFGTKPWSQMGGLRVGEVVDALVHAPLLRVHGYIYKCFDKVSGQSYMDPRLEAEIQ